MAAVDPLDPETFGKDSLVQQLEKRLEGDFDDVEEHGGNEDAAKAVLIDTAKKAGVKDPASHDKGFWDKVGGFFGL
ncbi:hypothetical protein D3C78_1905130 [compost metagenome]